MRDGPRRVLGFALVPIAGWTTAQALTAVPAFASSGLSPIVPPGVSKNGQDIHWLYLNLISPFALGVFVIVESLLMMIILRWRRSRLAPDYRPPQWHGHTVLEITWTVIPFLILCVVGYFSFRVLQDDFVRPTDPVTSLDVHIVAHQYGWDYEYQNGVIVHSEGLDASSHPLVVPEGKLVRIRLDSKDVIHSFWVPDITGKTDAVPGYSNYTWMRINKTGEWRGQCAELCGPGHATMQIRVKSVPDGQFDTWLRNQPHSTASSPPPST